MGARTRVTGATMITMGMASLSQLVRPQGPIRSKHLGTLLCAAALADTALGDVETVPTLWHLARYESCVEVSELLYTRNCWHESSTELAELLESNYADDEKRQVG